MRIDVEHLVRLNWHKVVCKSRKASLRRVLRFADEVTALQVSPISVICETVNAISRSTQHSEHKGSSNDHSAHSVFINYSQ